MNKTCQHPECDKRHYAHGWCKMHYARVRNHGYSDANFTLKHEGTCKIEDCDRPARLLGWCRMHYKRNYRYGDPQFKKKAENGEGHIREDGYKLFNINGKMVFEHILVAETALGKSLPQGAVVHHMNENRADNHTPFNLIICPNQAYHFLLHKRTMEFEQFGRCITVEYGRKGSKHERIQRDSVKREE
jgi:hypothetical protein